MANRLGHQGHLGHQKLKKEYFAGPRFLCPGGSLASSRMGQTCPKTSFYPSFSKFFLKICDFFAFGAFLCSQKSCFLAIFSSFFNNRQFKQIPYIYNYTFYVWKMWLKNFLTFWLGFVYRFVRRFFKVVLKKS
jgi:hypothetical protein